MPTVFPPHCLQRPGGLAKLGLDCTPFGLSLPPKGHAEVRVITLHPNFAKPLAVCWHFLSLFLVFYCPLLQHFSAFNFLQHIHLLDSNCVEFLQSVALRNIVVYQYGVDIFHIREAYQFIDSSVVAYIAFQVGVGFTPVFGCHSEQGYIQYVGFAGINNRSVLRL